MIPSMLNLFRRHVAGCQNHGKRTKGKCPSKPPCPIHIEGVGGDGKRRKPGALIDPRTGIGVRDWAQASEIVRDLEAPTPVLVPEVRHKIAECVEHFLKLKKTKSADTFRKNKSVLTRMQTFMGDRGYQHITEIKFADLTDWASSWTGKTKSKVRDLGIVTAFFKYCYRADFTTKHVGDGMFKAMSWSDDEGPREPFEPAELEALFDALPQFPDEYGRRGMPIAKQVEAFVLIMRYTGLDVSTVLTLPKAHVRGNSIRTYRLKNASEVWTVVPEWVTQKLWSAPHDSAMYFFWSGEGKPHTRASKWFSRLRKLLDLAKLQHRTPHTLRHTFAIEQLRSGTPIEDVSRLLGHRNIQTTINSYAAWIPERQKRLEGHQQRVWASDPLHQKMIGQVAQTTDTTSPAASEAPALLQ
jgi:site-specific recombinase XerD